MRRRREDTEAAVARVGRITPAPRRGWVPVDPRPGRAGPDRGSTRYDLATPAPSGTPVVPAASAAPDPAAASPGPSPAPADPSTAPWRPAAGAAAAGAVPDGHGRDPGPDPWPRGRTGRFTDPVGSGSVGAGSVGAGPVGAGSVGAGPVGAGSVGAGPVEAGPVEEDPVGEEQVGDRGVAEDGLSEDGGAYPVGAGPGGVGDVLRAALARRLPPALRGARFGPTGRGWRVLAVVLALAVVVSGGMWWRARSVPTALPAATAPAGVVSSSAGTPAASGGAAPSAGLVVVDVTGKVRRPGLVRLRDGARVMDAIRAAGGLRHGAHTGGLNLAQKVSDGQQIVVGAPPGAGGAGGAGGSVGGGAPSGAAASGDPVDLNTATADQLDTLPGVGPVLAQNILDYRAKNGPFRSVDQLQDVTGIGDARYAQLAPRVRV